MKQPKSIFCPRIFCSSYILFCPNDGQNDERDINEQSHCDPDRPVAALGPDLAAVAAAAHGHDLLVGQGLDATVGRRALPLIGSRSTR